MLIDVFSVFREEADEKGIVFYYCGAISQHVVTTMSESLKQKLHEQGDDGVKSRMVFSAFVEMMQNAMHYSPQTVEYQEGAIVVVKKNWKYNIISANFILKAHEARICGKLDSIHNWNDLFLFLV